MRKLFFYLIFIFIGICFVSAIPLISIISPQNNISTLNTSIIINATINEANLGNLIYNWNGTNFTIYNQSLVAIYNFDNLSSLGENSTYAVDVSKYRNNGTIYGAIWNSSGKYGSTLQFDGSTSYIDFGIPNSTKITDNITMSAWIKTTASSDAYRDVIANQWQYQNSGIMLTTYGTSTIHVPWSNGAVFDYYDATYNFADGNWHYISTTFSSGNIKIYADGQLIGQKNSSIVQIGYNNANHLLIGKDSGTGGTEYFNGGIDEVRIWNKSLSANEVYQQYTSNLQKFNSTQWRLYINQSQNATTGLTPGIYNYRIFSSDISGNTNQTENRNITIEDPYPPRISLDWVSPIGNINVSQFRFFNITVNITCYNANCSNINVSLDPSNDESREFCLYDYNGGNCAFTNNLCTDSYDGALYPSGGTKNYTGTTAILSNASSISSVTFKVYQTCNSPPLKFYLNGNLIGNSTGNSDCTCTPTPYPSYHTINNSALLEQYWLDNQNNTFNISLSNSPAFAGFKVIVNYSASSKGGLVSMNSSSTPFWTNVTNPYNLSLQVNESRLITWQINATGNINIPYNFFIYANITTNLAIGNKTNSINISITDIDSPSINIIYPLNITYSNNVNQLNYTYFDPNPGKCWMSNSSWNSSVVNAGVNFSNIANIQGNNSWTLYCNDSSGNIANQTVNFTSGLPRIGLQVLYPSGNMNIEKSGLFQVILNVSCNNANCGEINVSLDPYDNLNVEKDPISIASAINLYDNKSYKYDITDGCYMTDGNADTFDNGLVLYVNETQYTGVRSTTEDNGREAICNAQTIALMNISRKVYVPSTENWARYLEIFHNNQTNEVCVYVRIYQNMGSDGSDYMNTSDYDTTWELTDHWLMWDDTSNPGGDPAAGFIYQSDSASVRTTGIIPTTAGGGYNQWNYTRVCVNPGQTKIFMHFFTQWNSRVQAENESDIIYRNMGDSKYTFGMSGDEISQVVNWVIGKNGLISNTVGATPFWTNVTNPYNLSLNAGESRVITFWINASGNYGNYTFFAFANLTSDSSIGNITNLWNVTITNGTTSQINFLGYYNGARLLNISGEFSTTPYGSTWGNCDEGDGGNWDYTHTICDRNGTYNTINNKTHAFAPSSGAGTTWSVGNSTSAGIMIIDLNQTRTFNELVVFQMFSDGKVTAVQLFENYTSGSWRAVIDKTSIGAGYGYSVAGGYIVTNANNITFNSTTSRFVMLKFWNNGSYGSSGYIEVFSAKLFGASTASSVTPSDLTSPSVSLIYPSNGTSLSVQTSFYGNFTDNNILANSSLFIWNSTNSIINQTFRNITSSSNFTNISVVLPYNGIFKWNYYVCDNSSNCAFASQNNSFIYDNIPPYFTNISNVTIYTNQSLNHSINASDNIQFGSFSINWTSNFTINSTGLLTNSSPLAVGLYYINVTINDSAGNRNSSVMLVNVTSLTDPSYPILSIIYPLNTTYNVNISSLNYTTNKSGSCWVSRNNGITNSSIVSAGVNFSNIISNDGSNNWTLYCNNSANGYINSTRISFVRDMSNPNGTIISPSNGTYLNSSNQNFTINLTDNIGVSNATLFIYNSTGLYNQTTVMLNGATNIIVGIVVSLVDGIYNWFWQIVDMANNQYLTTGGNRTNTIDTTYPNINIIYPLNASYNVNISSLNYTVRDINIKKCWMSNSSWNSSIVNAGVNFTNLISNEGSNNWRVYCNDSAGNLNFSSINFIKDSVYPIFYNYNDNNGSLTGNGTAVFNVSVNITNGNIILEINNTNYTASNVSNSYNVSIYLSNGTYAYRWIAYGNGSMNNINYSSYRNYTINPIVPKIGIQILYPNQNIIVNKSNWFNVSVNISCINGNCGEINVSLDPIQGNGTNYTMFNSSELLADRYSWEEIIGVNGSYALWNATSADDTYKTIRLPFNFTFYGVNYTTAYVSSNMRVHFTSNSASSTALNNLPSSSYNMIAPYNYDMYVYPLSKVFVANLTNPNRVVIEYKNMDICCNSGTKNYTMELILYENGKIKVQYEPSSFNYTGYSGSYYIGTNFNFTSHLLLPVNAPDIYRGKAITFYPPSMYPTPTKYGLVSMNSSSTPFWTNVTNPYTINLNEGESRIVNFWVNASGSAGDYPFFVYANRTGTNIGNSSNFWNVTIYEEPTDLVYPVFYNYSDTNGTVSSGGISRFSVNINNTNGTVILRINGASYTADNSNNLYSVSLNLANGSYIYNWSAYGNGSSRNLNYSSNRYYTVLPGDSLSPRITINSPLNISYRTNVINFSVSLNENTSYCGYSLDGNSNITMTKINQTFFNISASVLEGSHNVIFSCNDSSGNFNFTSRSFRIDTLPPYVGFVSPLTGNYNTKTVTITIVNDSDARTLWFNRGLGNESYTTSTSKNFNEGYNSIIAYANDSVGNLNFTSISFFVDSISPSITINLPTAQTYVTSTIDFNITTNENSTCIVVVNSSDSYTMQNNGNRNFNISLFLADNSYSVNFYCNDSLNNLGTANRIFGVKTVPPQISLNSPGAGLYYKNNSVQFNYTPMATNGIDTCELWGDWTGSWHKNQSTNIITNYTNNYFNLYVGDGSWKWNVWCNNSQGLSDWSTQGDTTFYIDNTAPYVGFVSPISVSYNSSIITLEITNNSDAKNIWWNNGTNISYSSPLEISLADGSYVYYVYANDSAGNLNFTNVSFFVDSSLPIFSNYTDNTLSLYKNGTGKFNVTVIGTNKTVILNINGQRITATNYSANSYNASYYLSLNGSYDYYWTSYSNGTSNLRADSESRNYIVNDSDVTSPNGTIISPSNESYSSNQSINFTANISDDFIGIRNATVAVYNSTGLYNQTTINYGQNVLNSVIGIVISLVDGVYSWLWNIIDFEGNVFNTDNRTITIDRTSPSLNIISPSNNYLTTDIQIAVNYSVSDTNLDSCWYNYDNNENVSLSCSQNLSGVYWGTGQHNVSVWANDYAGNTANKTISFIVDNLAPVISLNSPVNEYINRNFSRVNVSFNCSVTDNINVKNLSLFLSSDGVMRYNNSAILTGTSNSASWTIQLYRGNYSWNCLGYDDAGNYDFAENNFSFMLDFNDTDYDEIEDIVDSLIGNESFIDYDNLNITVTGNSSYGTFSDVQEVIFYENIEKIINFTFNFTESVLDLSKVSIIKGDNYLIANFSGQLQAQYNKTMYIEDNNFISLCVKDAEIGSISEMSSGCDSADEIDFTNCLGNSTGVTNNSITCIDNGSVISVSNLRYSALRGTTPSVSSSSSSSSGGASGYECSNDIDCSKDKYCLEKKCIKKECMDNSECKIAQGETCWNWKCTKLFDMEILKYDSPVKIGSFFNFSYLVKAVAVINGDVEIDFWIEKNNRKYTEGKDTIYMNEYEQKIKTKELFLPSDIESGTYKFYIQVKYKDYIASSYRTIELKVEDEIVTMSPEKTNNFWIYVLLFVALIIGIIRFYNKKIRKQNIIIRKYQREQVEENKKEVKQTENFYTGKIEEKKEEIYEPRFKQAEEIKPIERVYEREFGKLELNEEEKRVLNLLNDVEKDKAVEFIKEYVSLEDNEILSIIERLLRNGYIELKKYVEDGNFIEKYYHADAMNEE